MSVPANGITADVFRDMMPPYRLSADLLQATLGALPPPPPDASAAWRQAHLTRLISEITRLYPADAGQARTAADILILRELADTVASRAHVPEATVQELCRLARTVAELARTAGGLVRGLQRTQQKPVPFYGTVIEDEVDIATLDQVWCEHARVDRPGVRPMPQPATAPRHRGEANAADGPGGVQADQCPGATPPGMGGAGRASMMAAGTATLKATGPATAGRGSDEGLAPELIEICDNDPMQLSASPTAATGRPHSRPVAGEVEPRVEPGAEPRVDPIVSQWVDRAVDRAIDLAIDQAMDGEVPHRGSHPNAGSAPETAAVVAAVSPAPASPGVAALVAALGVPAVGPGTAPTAAA